VNVIVDTSALQYLHQAGLLNLLPALYTSVLVPTPQHPPPGFGGTARRRGAPRLTASPETSTTPW
jgi:hypothetical protein